MIQLLLFFCIIIFTDNSGNAIIRGGEHCSGSELTDAYREEDEEDPQTIGC